MENKTEVPGIYKVTEGILINKDNEALHQYKLKKARMREQDNKINTLESKVDGLSQSMSDIKTLLETMLAQKKDA